MLLSQMHIIGNSNSQHMQTMEQYLLWTAGSHELLTCKSALLIYKCVLVCAPGLGCRAGSWALNSSCPVTLVRWSTGWASPSALSSEHKPRRYADARSTCAGSSPSPPDPADAREHRRQCMTESLNIRVKEWVWPPEPAEKNSLSVTSSTPPDARCSPSRWSTDRPADRASLCLQPADERPEYLHKHTQSCQSLQTLSSDWTSCTQSSYILYWCRTVFINSSRLNQTGAVLTAERSELLGVSVGQQSR